MTIYRYDGEKLVYYTLTDDELMNAHLEYQIHEDEMTVIGILDAAGMEAVCSSLTSDARRLKEVAALYREAIEWGYDGPKELQIVLDALKETERRSA